MRDADYDALMLLEEMEDFVLEDMAKLLMYLDSSYPLLVAVASVKELGTGRWDSDEDEGGSKREAPSTCLHLLFLPRRYDMFSSSLLFCQNWITINRLTFHFIDDQTG